MLTISRQLQLPYSCAQMYALVNDVAQYPQFVPFCSGTQIYAQDAHSMRAALVVQWQGIHKTLITQNKLLENQSISMDLVQGPIKKLQGKWQFLAQGDLGCEVRLVIDLDFNNRIVETLFSGIAKQVTYRLVDAFCDRARTLYG